MSQEPSSDDLTAKICQRREDLEDLADSDLPCADVAAALLEVAE